MKKKIFPVHVYMTVSLVDKILDCTEICFKWEGAEVKGIGEKRSALKRITTKKRITTEVG